MSSHRHIHNWSECQKDLVKDGIEAVIGHVTDHWRNRDHLYNYRGGHFSVMFSVTNQIYACQGPLLQCFCVIGNIWQGFSPVFSRFMWFFSLSKSGLAALMHHTHHRSLYLCPEVSKLKMIPLKGRQSSQLECHLSVRNTPGVSGSHAIVQRTW